MSKKAKRTRKAATPADHRPVQLAAVPADSRRVTAVLSILGLLLLAGVVLSYLNPGWRLWGLHHLTFLPLPLAVSIAVLAGLLWTPPGATLIRRISRRLQPLAHRPAVLWIIPVIFLCWILSVSVPLLGDGQLWITELTWVGKFESKGEDAPPDRWKARKEPLELVLHDMVFQAALSFRPPDPIPASAAKRTAITEQRSRWLNNTARLTYVWLSIAAGALTFFVTLRFARRHLPPLSRTPFLLTLFSGGGSLLFFGYIEHYSWVSFAVMLFVIAGLDDAFTPKRFPWRTLLAWVLAVACHLAAIFLLPALCFLLLTWRHASTQPKASEPPPNDAWKILTVFAVLGVAGYVWVKGWKGWLSVIPLLPMWTRDGYALFTLPHVIDLVNLLLLVAAPAIVFVATMPRISAPLPLQRIQNIFLALSAVCGAAFVFTFDPNLGMARDWDLLAVALWPLCIWGAWVAAQADWGAARPRIIAIVTGFAVLITLPYILVQSAPRAAIQRFETLLSVDRSRSAYGWESLAYYYRANGDMAGRIHALRNASEADRNPRYRINLAAALRTNGQLAEAESLCVAAVREQPKYAVQLVYIAAVYSKSGNESKARDLLRLAIELNPSDSTAARLLQGLETQDRAKAQTASQ